MKKTLLLSVLVTATVIFSATVSVNATESASKLSGRDYVSMGKLGALSGTLFEKDGEWFLRSINSTYELHIGNHTYRDETGINLKADKQVDITGFIYEDNVSVCVINIDNKEYRFRTDDGSPMWAGRGNGRNRENNQNDNDKPSWAGQGYTRNGNSDHTHENHTHDHD